MPDDVVVAAAADSVGPPVENALPVAPPLLAHLRVRVAVALVILAAFLMPLPWAGLSEPDEARYTEIAREMRESGDWITPRLNYIDYLLKPPLLYWLTAASQSALGATEAAARLVPAAAGLTAVLCAALLAGQMLGLRAAPLAALILATSPFFYALSLVVTFDVLLAATVTAALTAFWFGYQQPRHRRLFYLLLYASGALGVLVKGPVAVVMVGGSILLFLSLRREWKEIIGVLRLDGFALAGAIVLPWFLLVSWRHPEFPEFFVVRQHFQRYTNWGEHPQPWWYYGPLILAGMAPWTALVALSAERRLTALRNPGVQFCALWALWVIVFYSATRAKIGNYILPAMPPLAVLFAAVLLEWRINARRGLTVVAWLLGGLGVACLLASPILGWGWPDQRLRVLFPTLIGAGIVWLVLARVLLYLIRRQKLDAALLALGVGMSIFLVAVMTGRGVISQYRELGGALAAVAGPDDVIVSYGQYVPGLSYYTERRVVAAIGWGDLDSGRQHGGDKEHFWLTDADVVRGWEGPRRVFLVVNRSDIERLRPLLRPPLVEVASQGKKVALSNR